ncbi:MAG: TspO/MBR family protein [Ancrocorticia sp.]
MATSAFLKTTAATTVAAAVGTLFTDVDSLWYKKLDKPEWQPAPEVFPIAWTTLYAMIAHSSGRVLSDLEEADEPRKAQHFQCALLTNLALNAGWCYLFFQRKDTKVATIGAVALASSSFDLARRAGKVHKRSGLELLPYAAWTSFAAVLTAEVHRRNG